MESFGWMFRPLISERPRILASGWWQRAVVRALMSSGRERPAASMMRLYRKSELMQPRAVGVGDGDDVSLTKIYLT